MVNLQLPTTDTAGVALLWRLIEDLSRASEHVSPSSHGDEGFAFGLKALVVLLALLVLAVIAIGTGAIYFLKRWENGQREGIKALSSSKDTTKREIVGILEKQLSSADAANREAAARLRNELAQLDHAYNLIRLDLVVLAQKQKISLMSLPSHKPSNQQNFNENQNG